MKVMQAKLALHVAPVLIFLGAVMPVTFLSNPAAAQTGSAHQAAAPASAHFSASGLNNEDDLLRIYSGDFQSIRLDRSGTEFMQIISSYMEDFAKDCKQFLPPNKVEITTQVCSDSPSTVYSPDGVHDAYGNVINNTGCSSYQTVGTGMFADPQLYAAVKDVSAKTQVNMLGSLLGANKKGGHASGPFSMPQQMLDKMVSVGDEMRTVIHTNSCGSAGLKNFQSNLIRFANGEGPIKFAGAVAPTVTPGDPAKDTDFTRMLDDLVAANARGWLMNRYQRGSITDPIVAHDPLGDPSRIMARYRFAGSQGAQTGRVTVTFKDGAPDCLYFSDAPSTCREPAASVVSAYQKNAYAKSTSQTGNSPGAQSSSAPAAGAQRAGTGLSPAAFDPRWMGQNVTITGTVSRVEVDTSGSPQWVSIYFKESPNATFVLCSPYPDMLQEKVGRDLNALVGKTLEATGQVESPYCGGKAPKGSIRVVESAQWKIH